MEKKTQIKNVVFDMGNVLFPYQPTKYVEAMCGEKAKQDIILKEIFQAKEWFELDAGEIDLKKAWERMSARIPKDVQEIAKTVFERWFDHIEPNEKMAELIATLSENGYKIYLLSNTSEFFYKFKPQLDCFKYFSGVTLSYEIKMMKPNLEIYQEFFKINNLNAEECFFVDDMQENIDASRSVKMDGFVFQNDMEALRESLKAHGVKTAK
ncbi:MAG: HAD family phosphatase [Clostridia bacterium]